MKTKTCAECEYFTPQSYEYCKDMGLCNRYPPATYYNSERGYPEFTIPSVYKTMLCGEFKEKGSK